MKRLFLILVLFVIVTLTAGCHSYLSVPPGPQDDVSYLLSHGLDGNYVLDLVIDGNDLWSATPQGAYRWNIDTGNYRKYTTQDGLAGNYVDAIARDQQGNIWLCTLGGVSRFDGKKWKTFTTKDGPVNNLYTCVTLDKEGKLWFGTYMERSDLIIPSNGVSCYDGRNWKTYTTEDGLPDNEVHSICGDNQGNVWFGTQADEAGATRFDGHSWKTFTEKDGLIEGYVLCIYLDRQGKVWFGTLEGSSSYDGDQWQTLVPKRSSLYSHFVFSIFQDIQGNYWFGGDGGGFGVDRFDGTNWQNFEHPGDIMMTGDVNAISQDNKGNLWLATAGGLVRYDGNSWKTFTVN